MSQGRAATIFGLTTEQIQQALETSAQIATAWNAPLLSAMNRFEINTAARAATFLAQIGHESNGLAELSENLNYSSAGLESTFSAFTPALANLYGRTSAHPANQEVIANIAYANRYGNRDASSGDGYKFRGRGPIQTTFFDNYMLVHKETGLDCMNNPDILAQPAGGSVSAAFFFYSNGCNELADIGDFAGVTRKINPAMCGQADRVSRWVHVKEILGVA